MVTISPATERRIEDLLAQTGLQSADDLLNLSLDNLEGKRFERLDDHRGSLEGADRAALDSIVAHGIEQVRAGRTVSGDDAMAAARALVARKAAERGE